MEKIGPQIKLIITQNGLDFVTIHGDNNEQRSLAVDLYKLLQQEIKQFQRRIGQRISSSIDGSQEMDSHQKKEL